MSTMADYERADKCNRLTLENYLKSLIGLIM